MWYIYRDYTAISRDNKNRIAEIIEGNIILHLGLKICPITLLGKEKMRI